jgi:hypothetical protein
MIYSFPTNFDVVIMSRNYFLSKVENKSDAVKIKDNSEHCLPQW